MPDPMGRRRQHDHDLPPHMHRKVRGGVERFYYGRQGIALGSSFPAALRKYAELHGKEPVAGTFAEAATLFEREELPTKAPKTQKEYERQLAVLVRVFGGQRLDEIRPTDVAAYMRDRGQKRTDAEGKVVGGQIVATREKALLSAVISFARARGIFHGANPCAGIQGKKSKRQVFVTDEQLAEALSRAQARGDRPIGDMLELCYLTGQRPGDVTRLRAHDVQNGALHVVQRKTGTRVRITVEGPLAVLVDRLTAGTVGNVFLIRDERGNGMTLSALRRRFNHLGCEWWIVDMRAKAASDSESARAAQTLLGHAAATTTDTYIRQRAGARATPIMRNVKKP